MKNKKALRRTMESPVSEYESERELLHMYNEFYPQLYQGTWWSMKEIEKKK